MLRCKAIDTEGSEGCLFRIQEEGQPASPESLERVARIADLLLAENGLGGEFRVVGPGVLCLDLPEEKRTFFHNGIVFAALDAFNDPIKNPTLTLRSDDPT